MFATEVRNHAFKWIQQYDPDESVVEDHGLILYFNGSKFRVLLCDKESQLSVAAHLVENEDGTVSQWGPEKAVTHVCDKRFPILLAVQLPNNGSIVQPFGSID